MSKNEQIKRLFTDNYEQLISADITTRVKKNGICYDGIVDEAEFEKCETKIIFLLKETNGNTKIKLPDGTETIGLPESISDWDYREWLQEQQANNKLHLEDPNSNKFYGIAFNKLCMWIDIFYDCLNSNDISYDEYAKTRYNENNFRQLLKKTAIINLKKTWGKESTDWKDLNSYLHQKNNDVPATVLKTEINLIEPDVVICGSNQVFNFAQEIYKQDVVVLELANGDKFKYFKNNNTLFLDFYHPSCRGSIEKYYNYAKARFKIIKQIIKTL